MIDDWPALILIIIIIIILFFIEVNIYHFFSQIWSFQTNYALLSQVSLLEALKLIRPVYVTFSQQQPQEIKLKWNCWVKDWQK